MVSTRLPPTAPKPAGPAIRLQGKQEAAGSLGGSLCPLVMARTGSLRTRVQQALPQPRTLLASLSGQLFSKHTVALGSTALCHLHRSPMAPCPTKAILVFHQDPTCYQGGHRAQARPPALPLALPGCPTELRPPAPASCAHTSQLGCSGTGCTSGWRVQGFATPQSAAGIVWMRCLAEQSLGLHLSFTHPGQLTVVHVYRQVSGEMGEPGWRLSFCCPHGSALCHFVMTQPESQNKGSRKEDGEGGSLCKTLQSTEWSLLQMYGPFTAISRSPVQKCRGQPKY